MNEDLEVKKMNAYLVAVKLLIGKFTLANKEFGLSHVVSSQQRTALCGMSQRIGSIFRSMTDKIEENSIQCRKCRKAWNAIYSGPKHS